MSTYKLFRIQQDDATKGVLIDSTSREHVMARTVFRMWPIATCLPFVEKVGDQPEAIVLAVWENADDATNKRKPVAIVRTQPELIGFKKDLWTAPISA